MDPLFLKTAPPLDPEWLRFEEASGLSRPKAASSPLERQPIYAEECRALHRRMMAPGARDYNLSQGITVTPFTVPSSADGFSIPVLQYAVDSPRCSAPAASQTTVVYIHGGGLFVGEADSEELCCRRILKESALPSVTVCSIGYRLMPTYPARTCVSDCIDAFEAVLSRTEPGKVLVMGSSSGGELAAFVAGRFGKAKIHGLALRCPVTSDAFGGVDTYVPERLRHLHHSATEPSFRNSLLGVMVRAVPRDGLEYMPLEAPEEELRNFPKTWIQVCSNDGLYSDGVCFAKALEDVGVFVRVDVVRGWPHTFWLKAPELQRALEADREMLKALAWLAE